MRILRVLNELRPSGVEAALRSSAPEWRAHGVTTEIVSLGERLGPFAPALARAGYELHHVPLLPFRRFVPRFWWLVHRGDFDLVHVHPEGGNFPVALLARGAGRPVVRSVHNVFEFEGVLRLERRAQRSLLRALGVRHVSISPSVQQTERKRFGNSTACVVNWFDTSLFRPATAPERLAARQRLGVQRHQFVLVTVGNCAPAKNHGAVLQALSMLGAQEKWLYLHAGLEGSDDERALAAELGVDQQVRFLGQVDDVVSLHHAADCFLMPSRWEGLGNAALEALGCGVPSVLGNVPGLNDIARLVPQVWQVAPEPAAVANAITTVARILPEERQELQQATAEAAHRWFGPERAVAEYVELYKDLIGRRSDGRPRRPRVGQATGPPDYFT